VHSVSRTWGGGGRVEPVGDVRAASDARAFELLGALGALGDVEVRALEMIGAVGDSVPDLDTVALDDRATLRLLGRGHTLAVRYLNSIAARSALRSHRVRSIMDLAEFFETRFHPQDTPTHSAAQSGCLALESYRDAYLKANHPAEFMTAIVEAVLALGSPLPEALVTECAVLGVAISGVDPAGVPYA
jgi:DNA polymerase III alpha subunit